MTLRNTPKPLLEILLCFLRLGCVAFGGPVAHLAFFEQEFVRRRQWLSAAHYADLVALCQFLPGPASSQVGFAIGHHRGGVRGAFLAWIGFTLPSAVLMVGFAVGLATFGEGLGSGWITGLKLAAVAVVAQAIEGMARQLCPDRSRALLALASAVFLLLLADPLWQVAVIAGGAACGWLLYRPEVTPPAPTSPRVANGTGWPYLLAFAVLLIGLPLLAQGVDPEGWIAVTDGFYRAGSLVFGGGHIVLPLLQSFTVDQGWIDQDRFLAGYGAAQAMPGPLFAFTAFLGASLNVGPGGLAGGALALVATYVPSWLLVLGVLPTWAQLRQRQSVQAALRGANAAVVGLLLAAFLDPILRVAVTDASRLAFAAVAFTLLRFTHLPPWLLVLLCAAAGYLLF